MKNAFLTVILMCLSYIALGQDLPNSDFESWADSVTYEEPEFWNTPNPHTSPFPIMEITTTKSDDAYSGDYSVMLETKSILGNNFQVPGLITLAEIFADIPNLTFSINGGLALQENVLKLSGMYKYQQSAEGDSASVLIYNYKRNDEGEIDTIGFGFSYLYDTSLWTPFAVNMEYLNSNVPDTFNVIISSSSLPSTGFELPLGSILQVDSLTIETNTGIINLSDEQISVNVYPNPSADFVQFETSEFEKERIIRVYNSVGKLINVSDFSENKTKISVTELPSGLYTYHITKHNKVLNTGSFIKN